MRGHCQIVAKCNEATIVVIIKFNMFSVGWVGGNECNEKKFSKM